MITTVAPGLVTRMITRISRRASGTTLDHVERHAVVERVVGELSGPARVDFP